MGSRQIHPGEWTYGARKMARVWYSAKRCATDATATKASRHHRAPHWPGKGQHGSAWVSTSTGQHGPAREGTQVPQGSQLACEGYALGLNGLYRYIYLFIKNGLALCDECSSVAPYNVRWGTRLTQEDI